MSDSDDDNNYYNNDTNNNPLYVTIDGSYSITIIGVSKIAADDTGKLVDELRSNNKDISVQAVNAEVVYGLDHVLGVLRIALEAEKRGIMLANRRETELLLRLACTDQISEALRRAGLKNGSPGCFIAFSAGREGALRHFSDHITIKFGAAINNSVLKPSKKKRKRLSSYLGLAGGKICDDDKFFTQYLLERAAILVKK